MRQLEGNAGEQGKVLTQYRHNAKGAIKALIEQQAGEAVAALHHPEVGDIDLAWGQEGTSKSDGSGLAKLVRWHPEVLGNLQELISSLKVIERSENRVHLKSASHKAVVRLDWDGKAKKWLLTAFEKKSVGGATRTDTGAIGVEDDKARLKSDKASVPAPNPNNNPMTEGARAAAAGAPRTPPAGLSDKGALEWMLGFDGQADVAFSRSNDTQKTYEARIDELFAGKKASLYGVHLLDKSDVMDLLGLGGMPVRLDEAKVVLNQTNHAEMTAAVWKKIPEWLDDPAVVTKSKTVDGRYVVTPQETVLGYPVRIVLEPKGGAVQVHALVNAYVKDTASNGELQSLQGQIRGGEVVYVNTKKASELLGRSGLQLPRVPSLNTDRVKILSEKQLAGYRKATNGMQKTDVQAAVDAIKAKWANAPRVVVVESMQDPRVPESARKADAKQRSMGAKGVPEGFWSGGKVYMVADALRSPHDVDRVLMHEALGHHGLRGVFGDRLVPILSQLAALRRSEIIDKARQYGLVGKDADGKPLVDVKTASPAAVWAAMSQDNKLDAAEEVLATKAQDNPQMGFVRRAIEVIRSWLRQNVPALAGMKMTDAEIVAAYLIPARRFVEGGKGQAGGEVSFQRAEAQTADTPTSAQQIKDVERAYGGRAAYDRAKAAGKTKLTYGQWLQVRTPNFKQWFGDWEGTPKAKILNGKPLADLQTKDAPEGGYAAVQDWAAALFEKQGGKAVREGFGEVVLDKRAAKASMAHGGANAYKKIAFAAVKDVIERGALVHYRIGALEESFYFSAPIKIDGVTNIETVLVHRDPNTSKMYLHSVTTKESLLNRRVSSADTEASWRAGSTDSEGVASLLQSLLT